MYDITHNHTNDAPPMTWTSITIPGFAVTITVHTDHNGENLYADIYPSTADAPILIMHGPDEELSPTADQFSDVTYMEVGAAAMIQGF